MVKNEDIKPEFEMFSEIWGLYKRLLPVENTDDWWENTLKELNGVYERRKMPFCKDIVLAVIRELERKGKTGEKET